MPLAADLDPLTFPQPARSRGGNRQAIGDTQLAGDAGASIAGEDRIVPDLADLSGRDSRVDPGALQVVCERLYCAALASKVGRVITEHLYAKARWAEGVLAAHAEELLNQLGTDRPVGEQILASIASTRGERWMPAEQLAVSGEPAAAKRALGTLEDLNLVVKRQVDGRQEYAFANPIVAGKAGACLLGGAVGS